MSEEKEIDIRSDEVQEILSYIPHWMIRWGITLLFGIIIMLLFISWLIKYPDTIQGQATITTTEPPAKLVSKTNGYIKRLYFDNNTVVKAGDIIAEITNPTDKKSIVFLADKITAFKTLTLENNSTASALISDYLDEIQGAGETPDFGDNIQSAYHDFIKNLTELKAMLSDKHYQTSIDQINQQISLNNRLAAITSDELELLKQEVRDANEKFKADSLLYIDKVISRHAFFESRSQLTTKKQSLASSNKAYLNNRITVTNYQMKKNELTQAFEKQVRQLHANIGMSVKTMDNFITHWQQDYTFTAPIDGKITYLSPLAENQVITAQSPLFAIIPDNQNYVGHVTIPVLGYGKVKMGQRVRIKVDNFPHHEFGQMIGVVTGISSISTTVKAQSSYTITVALPPTLITTYQKKILFTPEMTGTAEVITQDLRLLSRIFNKFREVAG